MIKIIKEYKSRSPETLHLLSFLKYLKFNSSNSKDIVNVGLPRSGSTVLNLAIKEIISRKVLLLDTYCKGPKEYNKRLNNLSHLNIIKSHDYIPLVNKRVNENKSIGFFSHRDLRDILVSLIQKGWINNLDQFIQDLKLHKLSNTAILYAKNKKMNTFSYHDLTTNLEETLIVVADILKYELSITEKNEIYDKISFKKIKKDLKNKQIRGYSPYDKSTGLHENHIADGKTGKWRDFFNEKEKCLLNNILKEYNVFFNYPLD
jgi:hypothetical protein